MILSELLETVEGDDEVASLPQNESHAASREYAQDKSIDTELICSACGSLHHWQPRNNSSQWFCWTCEPPPSPTLVGRECGQPVGIIEQSKREVEFRGYYTVPELPCPVCRGKLRIETSWTDWSLEIRCWTCSHVFMD